MAKKIKNLEPHERPREKLLEKGARALSDKELLAVLLGKGTAKQDVLSLAEKLIPIIDKRGFRLNAEDLVSFNGIGNAKASIILAAIEFSRRRIKPEGIRIQASTDVLRLIQHYTDRKREHFICISLNGANEVITTRVVSIGLVNRTPVHPREVFADPLTDRASAIIVAHNHPAGDLAPSPEDIEITQRLKAAGETIGICLLDHIIFNHKGYYSFAEKGDM